jgi:hypothetical protein
MLHAAVWAALCSVSAQGHAAPRPPSVLIVTYAVNGEGIESADFRKKFEDVYNTYMQQVIDALVYVFEHNDVRVGTYVHRDRNTGPIAPVEKQIIDGQYEGLIELDYKFLYGSGGNRTVLVCDYKRLELSPSAWTTGGTGRFVDHVAKSYNITGTAGAELRTGQVATDCLRTISKTLFAPDEQWRLPSNK